MKPKIRYLNGSWRVTGGLVPIDLSFSAYESLAAAMDALCRWFSRGMIAPYK